MVKTLPSNVGGLGSTPDPGAKSPHASKRQNIRQKQCCNEFNKDWKIVHVKQLLKINSNMLSRCNI